MGKDKFKLIQKEKFVQTLKDAETLKPKTNAEIDEMVNKLGAALEKLSLRATEEQNSALKELQGKLEAMKKENFSAENKKVIEKTMAEITDALNNKELSQKDAEELISKANKVLELKPEGSGGETDKPSGGDTNKPSGGDTNKPNTNSGSNNTGLATNAGAFAGMMAISGLGAWFASRKRKGKK